MATTRSKPARSEQWRLRATQRAVQAYYAELAALQASGYSNEQTLRAPMHKLLSHCAHGLGWQLAAEASFEATDAEGRTAARRMDAIIYDENHTVAGDWEAKDDKDDLDKAIAEKFAQGYPKNNILFTTPSRLVLWQHGTKLFDQPIAGPQNAPNLVKGLELFFMQPGAMRRKWSEVVGRFTEELPRLGAQLVEIIQAELTSNTNFEEKFSQFGAALRSTVNPNIAQAALIEMLTQHLLTERLFDKVFENPEFVQRNAIARQLHQAVEALSGQRFRPAEFFKDVEYFYKEMELHVAWQRSRGLSYEDRLFFLNGIYERFFQGFSVKVADTHGIMYTPRPLVDFMLNSIDALLQDQFGLAEGMAAPGVHVLDPFCGTGNFLVRLMQRLPPAALARKYARELHANEVMLLPYYIAALNLEYAYHQRMGETRYIPFEGLCLVDSFSITPGSQGGFVFNDENTERVKAQQTADIMVIVGNPPYNAGQVNENDNNKNRLYPELDQRIRETYVKDSHSQKPKAYDPYVRAIRWASDRIRQKDDQRGIVAFVTNSGFLDGYSFDGMRWHLMRDFDSLHVLDLKGNVRKDPRYAGTTHNVFGIQVGVSVNLFARTGKLLNLDQRAEEQTASGSLHYAEIPNHWRKEERYEWLNESKSLRGVAWQSITPNGHNRWLHGKEGEGWEALLPLGSKETKLAKTVAETQAIFKTYCLGVSTNRDAWCYNFSKRRLRQNIQRSITFYNDQVGRWMVAKKQDKLPKSKAELLQYCDDLVDYDDTRLAWSNTLKTYLRREQLADAFSEEKIRGSLYRPFCTQWLYFDPLIVDAPSLHPTFFPTAASEEENFAICITTSGSERPFMALMVNQIPDLHLVGAGSGTQCFPLYTYNPDGSGRTPNLTGWGLDKAQEKYGKTIKREDVFYYAYAVLHHPGWRSTYAENLRMNLARLPLAPTLAGFEALSQAGRSLGELHVGYERAPEYPLRLVESSGVPRDELFRVEKMRWADKEEKTTLRYNAHLQVEGFPPEAQQYMLGNRSALDWVIDRYQIKADKRSGIRNDPNDAEHPQAVLRLLAQVAHVSCETVRLVGEIGQAALD